MKKIYFIAVFLMYSIASFGQVVKTEVNTSDFALDKEKTILQTNTDFLLAGEYLYYKLSVFADSTYSNISKIGYVELLGADSKVIFRHKLKIINGNASGDFFIPSEIRTGHYKLIGYTYWTLNNFQGQFYTKDVFIVNPFSSGTQKVRDTINPIEILKGVASDSITKSEGVTIATSKHIFESRKPVNITIKAPEDLKNVDFSLSVRKVDSIKVAYTNMENDVAIAPDMLFIPELRGELITGKISNVTGNGKLERKSVALSIPGKDYVLKISDTDKEGRFLFNVNENYSSSIGIFQILDRNRDEFTLALDTINYLNYGAFSFKELKIDPELRTYFEYRNIQNQVDNAYYKQKQDSVIPPNPNTPFYHPMGIEYVLDDYARFKTVRETFIEIISHAVVKKEGETYRFHIRYGNELTPDYDLINYTPLILIDGVIIQNHNDLANYDPTNIRKITLVTEEYFYGSKLYGGIIDVTTLLGNYLPEYKGKYLLNTPLQNPISKKKYYQPDYGKPNVKKRTPDYRRQLLWIPSITFANGKTNFSTYTSDNLGVYEIKLQGYTPGGKLISTTHHFKVE